jgi:hypothetical protein
MKKFIVTLEEDERHHLDSLTSKGKHRSQKVLNALILLACDEGDHQQRRSTNEEIARVLGALNGRRGSRVYEKKVDGKLEAHLIALSCSEPPEGFTRWSLRLLADKAVELDYIEQISHETVRRILKKTSSSLGRAKDG